MIILFPPFDAWHFSFNKYKLFLAINSSKWDIIVQKMSCDSYVDFPPYVSCIFWIFPYEIVTYSSPYAFEIYFNMATLFLLFDADHPTTCLHTASYFFRFNYITIIFKAKQHFLIDSQVNAYYFIAWLPSFGIFKCQIIQNRPFFNNLPEKNILPLFFIFPMSKKIGYYNPVLKKF